MVRQRQWGIGVSPLQAGVMICGLTFHFMGQNLPKYGSFAILGIFYQQTIPNAVFVWPIYMNLDSFGGKFVGKLYHALSIWE